MSRDRDLKYAAMFWENQPEGMLKAMSENIKKASLEGQIHSFAPMTGLDEKSKKKMSAYRLLADAIGYEIGEYSLNRNHGTVTASIKKREFD